MNLKMFAIYDQKAKAYLPPFFLPEEGLAIRTFTDCVNSDDHQFGRHPADYTLTAFGYFDVTSGELVPEDRRVVVTGPEVLRNEQTPAISNGTQLQPDPECGDSTEQLQ